MPRMLRAVADNHIFGELPGTSDGLLLRFKISSCERPPSSRRISQLYFTLAHSTFSASLSKKLRNTTSWSTLPLSQATKMQNNPPSKGWSTLALASQTRTKQLYPSMAHASLINAFPPTRCQTAKCLRRSPTG